MRFSRTRLTDAAPGLDAEQVAVAAETRQAVIAALEQLPEHLRTALLLKDGPGLRTDISG